MGAVRLRGVRQRRRENVRSAETAASTSTSAPPRGRKRTQRTARRSGSQGARSCSTRTWWPRSQSSASTGAPSTRGSAVPPVWIRRSGEQWARGNVFVFWPVPIWRVPFCRFCTQYPHRDEAQQILKGRDASCSCGKRAYMFIVLLRHMRGDGTVPERLQSYIIIHMRTITFILDRLYGASFTSNIPPPFFVTASIILGILVEQGKKRRRRRCRRPAL